MVFGGFDTFQILFAEQFFEVWTNTIRTIYLHVLDRHEQFYGSSDYICRIMVRIIFAEQRIFWKKKKIWRVRNQ
jgi:hypothetical protein